MIEPSDTERAEWPDATREYVEWLEAADESARQIIATERGEVMKLRREVDRLQAQVAAAVESSADLIMQRAHNYYTKPGDAQRGVRTFASAVHDWLLDEIINDDARAALDALLHQARIEGAIAMREAAASKIGVWSVPMADVANQSVGLPTVGTQAATTIRDINPEQVVKRDD